MQAINDHYQVYTCLVLLCWPLKEPRVIPWFCVDPFKLFFQKLLFLHSSEQWPQEGEKIHPTISWDSFWISEHPTESCEDILIGCHRHFCFQVIFHFLKNGTVNTSPKQFLERKCCKFSNGHQRAGKTEVVKMSQKGFVHTNDGELSLPMLLQPRWP